MRPISRAQKSVRRLLRAASTAPSSKPTASSSAATPSSSTTATPVLSVNKPSTTAKPNGSGSGKVDTSSPGVSQTKQGLGLTSIAVPFLVLAGLGGGFYAYKQGYFGEEPSGKPGSTTSKISPPKVEKTAEPLKPLVTKTTTTTTAVTAGKAGEQVAAPAVKDASVPEVKPAAVQKSEVDAAPKTVVAPANSTHAAPQTTQQTAAAVAHSVNADDSAVEGKLLGAALTLAKTVSQLEAAEKASGPAPVVFQEATAIETAKAAHDAWKGEQVSALLKKDAEQAAAAEVAGLSQQELRERVLQLHNELNMRSKWEAVHLIDMLDKSDRRWEAMFDAYARAKDEEAVANADVRVKNLKAQLEEEFTLSLDKAKRAINDQVQADATAKLRGITKELFERVAKETDARIQDLRNVQTYLVAAEGLLKARKGYETASWDAHRLGLTLAACDLALKRAAPATTELAALRVAAGGDAVIEKALSWMPSDVHSARGVPTLSALQHRYATVSKAARAAAMTPEGAGLIGQAVGTATSILVKGSAEKETERVAPPPLPTVPYVSEAWNHVKATSRSLVSQFGPNEAPAQPGAETISPQLVEGARKGIEKVKEVAAIAKEKSTDLAKINAFFEVVDAQVATGDISAAVDALGVLSGYPAEITRDWIAAARVRLAADRALSVARARAALRTAALY